MLLLQKDQVSRNNSVSSTPSTTTATTTTTTTTAIPTLRHQQQFIISAATTTWWIPDEPNVSSTPWISSASWYGWKCQVSVICLKRVCLTSSVLWIWQKEYIFWFQNCIKLPKSFHPSCIVYSIYSSVHSQWIARFLFYYFYLLFPYTLTTCLLIFKPIVSTWENR